MSKITITFECTDVDIATFLGLIYTIYTNDGTDSFTMKHLPEAIAFLSCQLAEYTDGELFYDNNGYPMFDFSEQESILINKFLNITQV